MHPNFPRQPELFTKVCIANHHLVITTIKGKIMIVRNYRSLLDSMAPEKLSLSQLQRNAILAHHMMVISTDSNILDLSTHGNKIAIRLSNRCRIHSTIQDFLLFLDAEYLTTAGGRIYLKSWAIVSPIDRRVLTCGKKSGSMVIDDFGICLAGVRKCELPQIVLVFARRSDNHRSSILHLGSVAVKGL